MIDSDPGSDEEESTLPPLAKGREPNQPIITSFFMKTPVEPKGKSEEQVAVKNTKAKLAASQERAQVENVLQLTLA